MKNAELRELETTAIEKKIEEARFELIKLNGAVASGTNAANPGLIKKTKKTIARLLTELSTRGKK